jgi:secondary thiamine-phosphate synthase enzyme
VITLIVTTHQREELIDITDQVHSAIREHAWNNGILTVFCPHTTAAITINENADPDVQVDIINSLNKIVPRRGDYQHTEGNSDGHVKSSLVGASEQIIVQSNEMVLGTWQGIYFCEFDGPRRRMVHLFFMEG